MFSNHQYIFSLDIQKLVNEITLGLMNSLILSNKSHTKNTFKKLNDIQ